MQITLLPELLGRLEASWESHGVVVPEHFAPGLSQEAIQSALADLATPVPAEITEWYGWHNGGGPNSEHVARLGPSSWRAMALEDALGERLDRLQGANYLAADMGGQMPASHWWELNWLPIAHNGGQGVLAVDLGTGRDGMDVRNVSWDDPESFRHVWAGSLADVVATWQRVLDTGGWDWDPALRIWTGDQASVGADPATFMLM